MLDGARLRRRSRAVLMVARQRRVLPPVPFVVLTTGRAGSTMLLSLLGSHPLVDLGAGTYEPLYLPVRRPWAAIAVEAARAVGRGAHAWGWSLHPQHLILQRVADHEAWVGRLHDEGFRIITLVRRNPVHLALSSALSAAKDQWHQQAGEEEKRAMVTLDPVALLRATRVAEDSALATQRLVGERSHLALVYEDHLRDPTAQAETLAWVLRFLGLPPARLDTTFMGRQAPFRDQIANYDELVAAWAGTRYSSLLDEAN